MLGPVLEKNDDLLAKKWNFGLVCLRIFPVQIATFTERHPRETFEKLKGLKKFVKAFAGQSK